MTDWQCFMCVCQREWRLMYARLGELVQPILFFALITCLMPLALPVSPRLLQTMGPGVLWMAVLLAMQLSLLSGFSDDYRQGTLSVWLMAPFPLSWVLLAVFVCRWARFMVPLLLVYPLLAMMYHFSFNAIAASELAVFCGSWVVFGLGFVLSGLLVRLLRRGWLLSCLSLPLSVPPLILVASIGRLAQEGNPVLGPMAWLGVLALAVVALVPWLTSLGIRLAWQCDGSSGSLKVKEEALLREGLKVDHAETS